MRETSLCKRVGPILIGVALTSWLAELPIAKAQDALERLDPQRFGPGTLIRSLEELEGYKPAQAVPLVLPLLRHADLDVARTAAWLLRRMERGSEGLQAAQAVLSNHEAPLTSRVAAAVSLGELRHANALPVLIEALSNDPQPQVRTEAAYVLGKLHRRQAAEALAQALITDTSELVRRAAACALGDLPGTQVDGLDQALWDSDPLVRLEATWSIGRRKLPGFVPALTTALEDQTCRVGAGAAWALSRLADPQACDALKSSMVTSCRLTSQAAGWALSELEEVCGSQD